MIIFGPFSRFRLDERCHAGQVVGYDLFDAESPAFPKPVGRREYASDAFDLASKRVNPLHAERTRSGQRFVPAQ